MQHAYIYQAVVFLYGYSLLKQSPAGACCKMNVIMFQKSVIKHHAGATGIQPSPDNK